MFNVATVPGHFDVWYGGDDDHGKVLRYVEDESNDPVPAATEHELDELDTEIDPSHSIFDMPEARQVEVERKTEAGDALVQTFYEGPPRCKCCTNWVEKRPPQIPDATKDRYDQAAIRIYKKKGGTILYGGIVGQSIDEIEIQSPVIIEAIQPLLAEVGIPIHSKRQGLLLSSPFKELYFAHSEILDLMQQHSPVALNEHIWMSLLRPWMSYSRIFPEKSPN
ncbi:MAG: hypothetical protein Q9208_003903 [Pyrenodesmia sp. 3 TL-2023]